MVRQTDSPGISLDPILLDVIRTIGVPGAVQPASSLRDVTDLHFRIAENNRVPLLFATSLPASYIKKGKRKQVEEWRSRNRKTIELMIFLTQKFRKLDFIWFKTLKPFLVTPPDVDLLMRSPCDLKAALRLLVRQNCEIISMDMFTATLYSPRHNLYIDLYLEPTVSSWPYLRGEWLFDHQQQMQLYDEDINVVSVKPEAEIILTCAHSLYKSQFLNLADFYTLEVRCLGVSPNRLRELAQETGCMVSLSACIEIMYMVELNAFGESIHEFPSLGSVAQIVRGLCLKDRKTVEFPYKYPLPLIIFGVYSKLKGDSWSRKWFPKALLSSLSRSQLKKALDFRRRKH